MVVQPHDRPACGRAHDRRIVWERSRRYVFARGGYRNGADRPAGRRELTQTTVAKVRSSLSVDPDVVRDRIRTRLETTPGRLNVYLIVLVVLGVLAGLSAVVGAAQRTDRIDSVVNRSGPLAVQAQHLYRALSDADATAAAAFLSSAAEPPAAARALPGRHRRRQRRARPRRRAPAPPAPRPTARSPGSRPSCPSTPDWWRRRAPRTGSTFRSGRPTCGRPRPSCATSCCRPRPSCTGRRPPSSTVT